MSTPFNVVFNQFLNLIEDDYYAEIDLEVLEDELAMLLKRATFSFPYPRVDLYDIEEENIAGEDETPQMHPVFQETLSNAEIQVLATLMKKEWLKRRIATMELVRQKYSERDFQMTSQAAHLKSLLDMLASVEAEAKGMIARYSRTKDFRPTSIFDDLATGGVERDEQ